MTTKNQLEAFKTFTDTLNMNSELAAQAFALLMQGNKATTVPPATPALSVMPVPQAPPAPQQHTMFDPPPAVEEVVEIVVPDIKFVAPNKQFLLRLQINKPCNACPFKVGCHLKPAHIGPDCGVGELKKAAVHAGEMSIKVGINRQTMKYTFEVYKNNLLIGTVGPNRENKPLIAELEKYLGNTVRVMTHLKKEAPTDTYTNLDLEILDAVSTPAPVVEPVSEPISAELPVEPPVSEEESFFSLGELSTPFSI